MRQYVSLPIEKLVSDVPVDPLHARELADSIMRKGQLAPVIVREETQEVIDGFHRIAAMKELGFDQVECVVTPCDDEGFWDFRIIQASLHKNVTFARAIDWIEKVFEVSSLRKHWEHGGGGEYKSAYSVFASYRVGNPPKDVKEWVETKSAMWGLAPKTIEDWLYTRQSLAPDLLKEATSTSEGERGVAPYKTVAEVLPSKPELQRRIMEKAKAEALSTKDVRTLAQALKRAQDDEEIIQNILKQPVARTEDQMVRDAKVEKILGLPKTPPETIEITGDALICMMDYNKLTTSLEHLGKHIDTIPPHAKSALREKGLEAISKIQEFNLKLYPPAEVEYTVKEIEQ